MILLGSRAWVALVDRGDAQHAACVRVLKDLAEPLASIWPIVSDVMDGLRELPKGQDVVWEMIERGAVQLLTLDDADVPAIRVLMRRHADRHMSFADAAMVHVAEREGIRTIFTVRGKEFAAYRLTGNRRLKVIP
jgi:uncharacterized protein